MSTDYQHLPVDSTSEKRLAFSGLTLGLVDTASADFAPWLQAEARGFHEPQPSEQAIEERVLGFADRRTTAVWDESGSDTDPVATVSSWSTPLTVPGRRSVPSWAVSAVTVSPTHRRKGIARALMEAELRTASTLGIPVAVLTASEATIYGRFGFAPAVITSDLTIDSGRTGWAGPVATGRIRFVSREQLLAEGHALVEQVRLGVPGQIGFGGVLWERILGMPSDPEATKRLRYVRYDNADGVPEGFAVYGLTETHSDYSAHVLDLKFLTSATDDAYAGLWQFLIDMDLVKTIRAPLRTVTEPVLWQLSDIRAATIVPRDHLWARILDVSAALTARSYSGSGRFVFDVSDPLDFAAGRFLLTIDDDGLAFVSPSEDTPDLTLNVNELSALYLGGVSATTLVRAGRIVERRPGLAAAVDRAFNSEVTPWLNIWF